MAPQEEKCAFAGLCIACLLLSAPATAQFTFPAIAPPRTDASACLELNSLVLPEVVAVAAEWLPAGPPRAARAGTAPLAALPAHCRVSASVAPSIGIEVWLPASAAWNGRFLGLGSTGTGGMLNSAAMATALAAGYATASTDDGHRPGDLTWLGNDRQLRDFAYRAIHEMTAQSRAFTAGFYGRPADYRYFSGCAAGGHQGLMAAEHFPDDYDGIVAGSPSPAFVDAAITRLWSQAATVSATGQSVLPPETLALVSAEALAQCDAADGVADGAIADPRRCSFEPERLQCGVSSAGRCLAPSAVEALRRIYAGPPQAAIPDQDFAIQGLPVRDLPGLAVGSERSWSFAAAAEPDPFTLAFFRLAVFADPGWNWRDADFANDSSLARAAAGWLDATAPGLGDFAHRGGRLIVYQAWSDSASPPEATINWYESALADAAAGTATFAQLFMVPGLAQCGGNAMTLDLQRAVEAWVERGIAPERIDTTVDGVNSSSEPRTLCPHPQRAGSRSPGGGARESSLVCAI